MTIKSLYLFAKKHILTATGHESNVVDCSAH